MIREVSRWAQLSDKRDRDDPRAERSRQALRQALIDLIKERDYDDIQILDITDRADTAKVTFYRHYKNKDDLLLDLINIVYQQILPLMNSVKSIEDLTDFDQTPPTLFIFLLLESDRLFFKRLLQTPKSALILQESRRVAVRQILFDTPALTEFDAQQIVSCIIGNAVWWLLNDIPYSAEQMARITHWLSISGIMGLREHYNQLGLAVTPP